MRKCYCPKCGSRLRSSSDRIPSSSYGISTGGYSSSDYKLTPMNRRGMMDKITEKYYRDAEDVMDDDGEEKSIINSNFSDIRRSRKLRAMREQRKSELRSRLERKLRERRSLDLRSRLERRAALRRKLAR